MLDLLHDNFRNEIFILWVVGDKKNFEAYTQVYIEKFLRIHSQSMEIAVDPHTYSLQRIGVGVERLSCSRSIEELGKSPHLLQDI